MPAPGEKRRDPKKVGVGGKPHGTGMIGKHRRAWVRVGGLEAIIYIREDDGGKKLGVSEAGESVAISVRQGARVKAMHLFLGAYSEIELAAIKHVFDLAFANALIVAKKRDLIAAQAVMDGDYTYPRTLRETPIVYVREGDDFDVMPDLHAKWDSKVDPTKLEFDFTKLKLRADEIISSQFENDQEVVLDDEDAYEELDME